MSLIWRPVPLAKRRARRLDPPQTVATSRPFPGFTLRFSGAATDVPPALRQALSKLDTLGLAADWRSTVELVLAETLNNIAEHAYAGQPPGPVTLTARMTPDRLCVILRDQGCPLPGQKLPEGRAPNTDVPCASLPEGGFGWFLIRDLTTALHYRRTDQENRLQLEFDLTAPPKPG